MIAPTISTKRLRLRPHQTSDFDALANLFATNRSCFMDGPMERWQVWDRFAAEVGSWVLQGCGSWAIDLHDGTMVGQVGINKPDYFPEHEIGWLLYDGFEGQGYATEAAGAAKAWAFYRLDLTTLVSYIDPPNAPSIRVAERLGGQLDESATPPSPSDLVYRYKKAVPWKR
jgi:RimJ/RimL family protein N-acetyltransferase